MSLRLLIPTLLVLLASTTSAADRHPNVILILADDLGSAELGCYGQKKIRTPALDAMAREGLRFTQFYSGNAVCATSRCVLMTGRHTGHCIVRDNREVKPEGQFPIPAEAVTIAELLKARGYATGAIGKWGLGPPGSVGDPNQQGFDLFYGYNCQRVAHNHYPTHLWRNQEHIQLEGNTAGVTGKQHTHDLFEQEALAFVEKHRAEPFFLYLPFTIPHVALQVPDDSLAEYKGAFDDETPYEGKQGYLPHPQPHAAYAAMVTRMDRSVGRLLAKLKELKIDEQTLVLFTSDNGPTHGRVGGADSAYFQSAGNLRGLKGSLYEGGIRVPLIARWPGHIQPEQVSDLPCVAYDLLPTFCELAGDKPPADCDGISLLPTLLGKPQTAHEFLYWEFPGYGGQQAVRMGKWKGIRQKLAQGRTQMELYDLSADPGEASDIADKHPEVVERIAKLFQEQHVPSPDFPLQAIDMPVKKRP